MLELILKYIFTGEKMNSKKLESRVNVCAAKILNEKGYFSPIDLLLEMDRITPKQVEEWRLKKYSI